MLNKYKGILYFAVMSVGFMFLPKVAIAACTYVNGGSQMHVNWSLGNVIVPKNSAVGDVLFTKDVSLDSVGNHTAIYCIRSGGTTFSFNFAIAMSGSSLGSKIYASGVPGIGLRVSSWSRITYYQMPTTPTVAPFTQTITVVGDINSYWGTGNQMLRIEVVRTAGYLGAGSLSYSVPGFLMAMDNSGGSALTFGTLNVNARVVSTCSVNTPNVQVPLDDVYESNLVFVGTTVKPKVFNVDLSCDNGANITAQMTGVQNADTSAPGVLQLTSAGSAGVAKGVGIQILYNNAPLALNNNLALKTSTGGQETFPFTAQYYQTKSVVTAGSANAIATLNVTYQ